ncbi:MAG: histidine kinase [Bacteroidota bacterium]|nr:histidine kinase [Bacteroidota bacterium]
MKISFLTACLCISGLFITSFISAQNFNIETYTTRQGLANDNVRDIVADSSGFLWIATWDGISRYDGYSFTNYYHRPDDSLSLPYFSIMKVLVDGGNNLWILTDNSIAAMYDRFNDRFTRANRIYSHMPESISSMGIDESGYLWLIKTDSLFRFDYINNRFNRYQLVDKSGLPLNIVSSNGLSISVQGNDEIWVVSGTSYEFRITNNNKLVLNREYTTENKSPFKRNDFNYIYWHNLHTSRSGRKWITSNSGLYLLDESSGIFREFRGPLPDGEFSGNGFLTWSWYNDGIYLFDLKEGKLSHIPHEFCLLTKNIYCQNRNLIWFSNFSMTGSSLGFSKVVFTPDYFRNYPLPAEKNDIPAVYAITKDKNDRLWIGMRGNNPVIRITKDNKAIKLDLPEYNNLVNPGAVRSLNVTEDGLWIGFFRELLVFYNFKTGQFTRHLDGLNRFRPAVINKEGNLYFDAGGDWVKLYHPVNRQIEKIYNHPPESPVYKILIDNDGILWAGSNRSTLIRIDPSSRNASIFSMSADNYNIEDICHGDYGDLWLATLGAGVCRFYPGTGEKKFYTTSAGLSSNITYGILKDKEGNIWVSTNKGICRINPKTEIIRTFGPAEGLNIIEFNSGAVYRADGGEFFMGGMGGLVGFNPDLINKVDIENANQKIIINEIRVSGKPKPYNKSLWKPDTLILNKGENNLRFYFSSSDFVHSDKTIYRYMLSGANDSWIETDSRNRSVSYANLSPGWYNFQVEATDRSGSWDASKEIRIMIRPLFYQTLAFKISIPVLILVLIIGMGHFYVLNLKRQESHKQDTLRLKTLRGQMNPHFIFNSLNSINYFISRNDKLSANRYISDFSRLIRSILYNMENDYISLENEIDSLRDYLKIEHLRFGDKFDYEITVDHEIEPEKFKISSGLIQPFVENAIWHGLRGLENRKGLISVKFTRQDGKIACMVTDDGIGRTRSSMLNPVNREKESRGIGLAKERLKIINKIMHRDYQIIISDLYQDREETGTSVAIDLPVEKVDIPVL